MAGVVQAQPRHDRAPVGQHAFEPSVFECIANEMVGHEGDPDPVDCGVDHQRLVGQRERAADVHRFDDTAALEFPAVERTAIEAKADAVVPVQILRHVGAAARAK